MVCRVMRHIKKIDAPFHDCMAKKPLDGKEFEWMSVGIDMA